MFWKVAGLGIGRSAASLAAFRNHATVMVGSPPVTSTSWLVRSKVEISSSGVLPCSSSSQSIISKGPRSAGRGSTIRVRATMS